MIILYLFFTTCGEHLSFHKWVFHCTKMNFALKRSCLVAWQCKYKGKLEFNIFCKWNTTLKFVEHKSFVIICWWYCVVYCLVNKYQIFVILLSAHSLIERCLDIWLPTIYILFRCWIMLLVLNKRIILLCVHIQCRIKSSLIVVTFEKHNWKASIHQVLVLS